MGFSYSPEGQYELLVPLEVRLRNLRFGHFAAEILQSHRQ